MPEALLPYNQSVTDRPDAAGAIVLLIVVIAVFLLRRRRKSWLSHLKAKPLLTANETEFLYRLRRALPGHHVFPQVSFAAFITDDGKLSTKARWSVRAKFDRKIADFVICDRNLTVLALVELDDRTHVASADRQRDALTRAAGYQTLRFQSKQKPSEAEIAALFQHARAWTAS
jgi:MYXO-CTERM domain-containing protein